VNDIAGGLYSETMFATVARLGVPYILMHMRGTPKTMRDAENTTYDDLIGDIHANLAKRAEMAMVAGVNRWNLVLDPGVGFALTREQSFAVMRGLPDLRPFDLPLLVGPSRKGMLGQVLQAKGHITAAEDTAGSASRLWATGGVVGACVARGADVIRVHDCPEMVHLAALADTVHRGRYP
jgi:dihydropteroate synthase